MNSLTLLREDEAARVVAKLQTELSDQEIRCLSDRKLLFPLFETRFLVLSCIKENPKGDVLRAIDCNDLSAPRLCVVKEANPTHGIDDQGRDACDRLRHEAGILRALKGFVRMPELYAEFQLGQRAYLVTEYICGLSLDCEIQSAWFDKSPHQQLAFLNSFTRLIDEVTVLHAAGYVHRDLALSNIRVSGGGSVYLMDFELAHKLKDGGAPFHGGTPGFLSPQQRCKLAPDITDDVYTMGANLLAAVTGCDAKIILFSTHDDDHLWQLCSLQGLPPDLIQLMIECVDPRPEIRPGLPALREKICAFRNRVAALEPDEVRRRHWTGRSRPMDCRSLVQRGLEGLLRGVPFDSQLSLWVSPVSGVDREPKAYRIFRNAYKGLAGILYVLCSAHRLGIEHPEVTDRIHAGLSWLLANPPPPIQARSGLFFGEAGVAVAVAEAFRAKMVEKTTALVNSVYQCLTGCPEAYGVADGLAGIGIASLICFKAFREPAFLARAKECANRLVASQNDEGSWSPQPSRPAGVDVNYGFGRGASGIVYFLAEYAHHVDDERARKACKAGAGWVLQSGSYSLAHSRVHWRTGAKDREPTCWWLNGSSGIALMLLSVYKCTGDSKYARLAREALLCQPKNLARAPMSQEHGLSGLGEIYEEAALILQEKEWHERAIIIGQSLQDRGHILSSQEWVWFIGDRFIPDPSLMTGSAGVVHFFLKLLLPEDLPLPFLL